MADSQSIVADAWTTLESRRAQLQVIAPGGTSLLVYGHRDARARSVRRDDEYRPRVANYIRTHD
jgi:hypothetical protein